MSNEEHLYERLIQPIQDRMIRTVWRILRNPDDTDDAFQEALETIWKRLGRIQRHPNPQALILRICANAAYDVLRQRIRLRGHETAEAVPDDVRDTTPSVVERVSQREGKSEILRAIAQLPRKQAEAVLMRFVQEQSYGTIAEALGCSEATARIHVSRGRARLSERLAHLAPYPEKEVLPNGKA